MLYVAHAGDSGAVMACSSFDLSFPLRLTADHKPNRCAFTLENPHHKDTLGAGGPALGRARKQCHAGMRMYFVLLQ